MPFYPAIPGLDRSDGLAGPVGPAGSKWYDGSGAPLATLGVDGDYYLDHDNGDVYTKTAGAWAITGNIAGSPYVVQPFSGAVLLTVTHNLGRYVDVMVYDESGEQVDARVSYVDSNQVRVEFNTPLTGTLLIS